MKRILLIMPYGSVGGMERLAYTFYKHFKEKGYEVKALKFIKLETDIINFGEDELFLKSNDFNQMSKKERAYFYLKAPGQIRRLIKKYNISDSIAFGDMANMFSSLTFTKEFKIASIHALKSVEFSNETVLNKLFKLGFSTTYKNFNKVVCISKAIKDDLINNCGYKFNNLEIIYNPHNVKTIVEKSKEPIDDSEEIKIFKKEAVLFLGRLSIQKSPWHLINAFSIVHKQIPDAVLAIIGDGDKKVEKTVQNLIEKHHLEEVVFLMGRRNNPYKYMKASKVLVLSSHYEGTPNVIVESIAAGLPVVSSNCTKGIVELMSLEDHEESETILEVESGIITPNLYKGKLGIPERFEITLEEQKLAEALISVLKNQSFKNNLDQHRTELLAKFDLDKVAENYLAH